MTELTPEQEQAVINAVNDFAKAMEQFRNSIIESFKPLSIWLKQHGDVIEEFKRQAKAKTPQEDDTGIGDIHPGYEGFDLNDPT